MEEMSDIIIKTEDDFITYNDRRTQDMECALTFRKKVEYDFRF